MYLAGHLLSSIALAKTIHKPLRTKFFALSIAMMAVNLVDTDHLIYYFRDSGVGDSFQLHPLHQLWSFVGLIICLLALLLKPYRNLIFGFFLALVLHYGLDALANLFAYHLEMILGFELLIFAVLILLFRRDPRRLRYDLFFVGLWIFCNATLGFETRILHWEPHLTRGIYLTSVILNILAIGVFWILFAAEDVQALSLRKSVKPKNSRKKQ